MLFNSIEFLVFLPLAFLVYWLAEKHLRAQNLILLAASYLFYGWWDYRFLSLIILSSVVDFAVALCLGHAQSARRRKSLLAVSVAVNLGVLGFFKYFDFFAGSFAAALSNLGLGVNAITLEVILPVGISFYTFQTLSYTIDVYRGKLKPISDWVAFFAFVAFFPQLVAGPIERASNLLSQFTGPRRFDTEQARDGLRQMLWGLFKKVVIADNIGTNVDRVFNNYAQLDGLQLAIGVVLFAFQIYCDFSGYSDIAIGCARLFGFSLMRNFAYPYFARDIGEFWQRWHISLSTWFRDYFYIPLGGSRCGPLRHLSNVILTFVVSGLWHGANWTFVAWGLLHGLYYIPVILLHRYGRRAEKRSQDGLIPAPGEFVSMVLTFSMVCVGWVLFRSDSIADAYAFFQQMFAHPLGGGSYASTYGSSLMLCVFLLAVEWVQRGKQFALDIRGLPVPVRSVVYYGLLGLIFMKGRFEYAPFIYFQF